MELGASRPFASRRPNAALSDAVLPLGRRWQQHQAFQGARKGKRRIEEGGKAAGQSRVGICLRITRPVIPFGYDKHAAGCDCENTVIRPETHRSEEHTSE